MAGKALTDIAARRAKAKDKPYKLAAGGGLYLEVTPTGSKYWRMKYRFAGREKRLAIGVYPEVTLKQAVIARDAARALLREGRDPSAVKQAAKHLIRVAAENSLEAVAREWLEVKAPGWTALQLDKERSRLENHAFPWVGKVPIAELGVADIKPLLSRLVKRGHTDQAHRLRQGLSRIFRFAIATERAERDPAGDLRDTLPVHNKRNFASILEPEQVGELLRAIDGYAGTFPTACALKLAPLWFVRPGELRAAQWSEFDLDSKEPTWAIPAIRSKMRKADKENPRTPPHLVPLSGQAVAVLRELQQFTGTGHFLFPSVRDRRRPMSENTINAALRRLGYDKETMTGHGFRHLASTLLNEMGFHRDAIERQLAHKEPGVRGVYNKAKHMPERRQMMQAWADYLDSLRSGGNVVAIRSRA